MNCALVLKQIPLKFWDSKLNMAFIHKYNDIFLCHFRRLVHLAMIFRRRILKHLCVECNMIDRMIQFLDENKQRFELHGYILQMLNDIYCHRLEYCEHVKELSLVIISSNSISTKKYILNSLYTGNYAQDLIIVL